jgi:alpha-L-fucosidase 2
MPVTRREFLYAVPAAGLLTSTVFAQEAAPTPGPWTLWYRDPAKRWLDSLPVGNGRLGAMVFGGVAQETIALNESTVWSGSPNASSINPSTREYLGEMRQLIFDGKYADANALCGKHLNGREDSYGTHLPMATLVLDQPAAPAGAGRYRRWLDLETGLARVEYGNGGVSWTREVFASNPDNVIAVRLSASQPGQVSLDVSLDPKDLPGEVHVRNDQTLVLLGSAWEKRHSDGKIGVNFQTSVRVLAEGGSVAPNGAKIEVRNADAVVLLVAANTSYLDADFPGLCDRQIAAAAKKGYAALHDAHVADHRRLFRRVSLDLGGIEAAQKPTGERMAAVRAGADDPQLSALFFQYGRYLLIAGSRENSPLPMNLQGIWNDNLAANMVWTCDFHLDINTQQNYWPTEVCNLPECGEPLFKLLESLAEQGRGTAREMYGARGWVCHVYTDAWGFTAPGAGLSWGPFVTGGIWTAAHLWEHYLFTRDKIFLAKRAYPVLKSAAEFFLDYMVEHPRRHWLVTGPSNSPENTFLSPDGKRCNVSMGPTCDQALVAGLFASVLESATVLGVDAEFRARVAAARTKLPPFQIGKFGQLQEWLEDFDEAAPNHRHTSHLVALYPLGQITPEKTPDLAKAARVTIERRTGQKNWEDVEWSRANLINFFARLQDGDAAHKHVLGLLKEDSDQNLMTFSRAGIAGARDNIFAIDGNTAGTAGIAEMLLQSHNDLHLLPALPGAWPAGAVSGLRARGGFEVALQWKAGALTSATVGSTAGGKCQVRYRGQTAALDLKPGSSVHLDGALKTTRG